MTSDWQEVTLGEVIELKRGYDLPQQVRTPGPVPIVSSGGILDYHDTAMVMPPGVVTGRYGTLGNVYFIQEPYWPLNTTLYVRDFKGNDPRFISYFLKSVDFLAYSDKAAVPGLNRNHLHQAIVHIPPLAEQKRIAHILGTLDDKIELNRRMNATLEAMARALFKAWFVDFDPVRAKAAGRDPGLPADIAALFPAALVESELGVVPQGWGVRPLASICTVAIGGHWGEEVAFEGGIETVCLRGVDLEQLRMTGWSDAPKRWFRYDSLEKRQLHEEDVLVAASGVGPLGRPLWVSNHVKQVFDLPVTYSNFCKRLTCSSRAYAIFLDRVLHNLRESGLIWEYANGTSIPNLDVVSLLNAKYAMPPIELVEAYSQFISPIHAKLFSGESLTLAALRDTLLPRLLAGEVSAGAAE